MGFLRSLLRYEPFVELSALPRTVLAIGESGSTLYRDVNLARPLTAQVPVQHSESSAGIIAFLSKGEEIVISISIERCFSRHVKLPQNALAKVEKILDLDIARITPFSRQDVFSGWIAHAPDTASSPLNVEHILIQKAFVADVLDAVQRSGARSIGFIVHDTSGMPKPMALSRDGGLFGLVQMRTWCRITGASLGVLMSAALVFSAVIFLRQSHGLSEVQVQTQGLEKVVAEVRHRLDVIKSSSAELSALQVRNAAVADRLAIIEEMSRILPDDAFLDAMVIDANQVNIDGNANSPEQLIAALEASPMFQNVSFSSANFKNPGDAQSHFSVKLDLEPPRSGSLN